MNKRHYNVGTDLIRIFAMLAVISAHLTLYLPKTERKFTHQVQSHGC